MSSESSSSAIKLSLPLAYQQEIFREIYDDDHLAIIARGLGLHRVVTNLLHSYDATGGNLVILVGADEAENTRFGEDLAEKAAISRATKARGLIVVNTDVTNVGTREKMYARGGVFTITSRILVVDLLTGLLDPESVTGLVVLHAEKVVATSLEAFIIRIFRQKSKDGFVKAFSGNPEAFTSGFAPLSTMMRNLFLRKSSLWPRYHLRVAQSLEVKKAEVVELEVAMTTAMQDIQNAVLQCIEISISELRKANVGLDIEDWSVDSALHRSFDAIIRRQLDPIWHRVSWRTRQIASDLTTLRTILQSLLAFDAVTFHQYLETVLAAHMPSGTSTRQNQSPWLFLDAADTLFTTAKRRVYSGNLPKATIYDGTHEIPKDLTLMLEEQPKWQVLADILDEIDRESLLNAGQTGSILIMCPDRRTCSEVREFLQTMSEIDHDNDPADTDVNKSTASVLMRRKFRAFLAWRSDFARFKSSSAMAEQHKQAENTKNLSSGRKAPANKRRRVRGGAQGISTGSRQPNEAPAVAGYDKVESAAIKLSETLVADMDGALLEEELVGPEDLLDNDYEMHSMDDIIVIHPYGGDADDNLLEELRPRTVIMYGPDAAFIRRIEVYRSSHTSCEVRVYFMYYGGSVEEQTYLSMVRREKDAFTKLIREKGNMTVTLTTDARGVDDPQERFLRTLNTRIAGGGRLTATAEPPRVVVDVREFGSSLPSLLHGRNIVIIPCTLTVGDYVLSPTVCVERKSVKDLVASFKDGRLYSQAEAMLSTYRSPMLLIEFDQDKSFNLEPFMDLTANAAPTQADLQAKLVLLTLTFPRLKIIWSSSPYQTAEIFEELKKNQDEPDPLKAVSIGLSEGEDGFSIYSQTPMDLLRTIPGVTDKNYKNILFEVDNMLDLCNLDQSRLEMMIGPEAGRRVYNFFNKNVYESG